MNPVVYLPQSRRLLEQVRESEMMDSAALVRALTGQPIAALMVDPGFSDTQVAVPLLISSGTFPHNAESTLNRLIIERRAELYRIGSDLSRALSTATISGAALGQLLFELPLQHRRQYEETQQRIG